MKQIVLEFTYVVYLNVLAFGPRGLWSNWLDGKIIPLSKGG